MSPRSVTGRLCSRRVRSNRDPQQPFGVCALIHHEARVRVERSVPLDPVLWQRLPDPDVPELDDVACNRAKLLMPEHLAPLSAGTQLNLNYRDLRVDYEYHAEKLGVFCIEPNGCLLQFRRLLEIADPCIDLRWKRRCPIDLNLVACRMMGLIARLIKLLQQQLLKAVFVREFAFLIERLLRVTFALLNDQLQRLQRS